MTARWADLVTLAEELNSACMSESNVDPEKVRKLARGIIELPSAPDATPKRRAQLPRGNLE